MFDRPDHDRANEWVIEALSSENHIMEGKITEDQERIAALEKELSACQAERDRYREALIECRDQDHWLESIWANNSMVMAEQSYPSWVARKALEGDK